MRQGLKTSISVDDHLILYLGNRLAKKRRERPSSGEPLLDAAYAKGDQKEVHKKCRLWIQHLVDAAGDLLPDSGISQWVQARIVDAIADPTLKNAEMQAMDAQLQTRVQAMDDERWAAYEADEARRKNSLETRAFYESLARKEMEKTPKHKWPRIGHFKSK
jgi:hypothetical protein